jgi:hypothetical protein
MISFRHVNVIKNNKKKKGKNQMKEKVKRWSIEALKILAIAVVIGTMCVTAPYCKGLLWKHNYLVVTDGISAEQTITDTGEDDVLVEFRCPSNDFPRLLTMFVNSHKQLDFKMVEPIHSDDPNKTKGFIATFLRD